MPRRARYAVAAQSVSVLPTLPPRSRPRVRASQAVREIEVGWKDKRLTKEQSRLEYVRSLNKKQLKEEETGRQVRAAFFSIKKDSGSQVRVEAVEHAKVVEKSKEEFRKLLQGHFPDPDILLNKNRMEERQALDTTLPCAFLEAVSKTCAAPLAHSPAPWRGGIV